MAGPPPPPASLPHYEDWILETIDSLRSRKARPDLERICRMVRRRHGPEPERTRLELERLVQRRAVLRVSYKGSISYRNAARLQPPRRSRGKGASAAGAQGDPQRATPGVQAGGSPQHSPPGGQGGASPPRAAPGVQAGGTPQHTTAGVSGEGNSQHAILGVQGPGNPQHGTFRAQEGGYPHHGTLAMEKGVNPQLGTLGLQGGGKPQHGILGGQGAGIPQEGEFGMQGGGSPSHGTLGMQWGGNAHHGTLAVHGRGSPKGGTFGVQGGVGTTESHFGVQGGGSPPDGTLGMQGGLSSTEAHFWVQGGGSPQDGTFGVQWGGIHKNAQFGVQGDGSPPHGNFGVHWGGNPKDPKFGVQGEGSPKGGKLSLPGATNTKDGKLWGQGGVNPKDGKLGVHRGGSPKYGMFAFQEEASPKDGMFALQGGWNPKDGTFGVQGGGSPKDGMFGVQGGMSPKEMYGMQEGLSPKDGKLMGQGEDIPMEDRSRVQERLGVLGEDKLGVLGEGTLPLQDRLGMLAEGRLGLQEKQVMLGEGRLGVLGEQTPGLQGRLGVLGETSPKHGSGSPREMGNPNPEFKGTPKNMVKGIPSFQRSGSPKVMATESPKDVGQGFKSTDPGAPKEKKPSEECQELLLNGSLMEAMQGGESTGTRGYLFMKNRPECYGDEQGSPGPSDEGILEPAGVQQQGLRRVKRGTLGQEDPPSKKPRTSRPESPEPGVERSRRSLGIAPIPEVPPAPSTRSGSRRSPSSVTPPRAERLIPARGRWQQKEERDYGRRQRSRPDRSAARLQEAVAWSAAQSSRATRSKKMQEELTKEEAAADTSMLSEGSEPFDAEEAAKTCTDEKNMKSAPAESDVVQVAEPSRQGLTDKSSCEQDIRESEDGRTVQLSGKDGPSVFTGTQPGSPMEKPFNLSAAVHRPPETTAKCVCDAGVSSPDKNRNACNVRICPRVKSEKGCNASLLSMSRNANGCNTSIGPLNRSTSVCPRVKREEGCSTSVYPLGECAVKAVPVEKVKLEDDAGEPRDCEASLGIEGVEPHLPIRVSPVTPMILAMDRTSYRKISVTKKPSDPVLWTVTDVVQYFTDAGFAEQASAFQEQEIDGRSLLLMQRTDVLTGLSIRLGPALKMYEHHIKILQQCHFAEEGGFLG